MKAPSSKRQLSKEYRMRFSLSKKWMQLAASGAVLFGLGGCLGPNPGFFISSSAANTTISTLVSSFLSAALNLGGG